MKLKFRNISSATIIFILGWLFIFLPYIFAVSTKLLHKEHYLWFIYFEILLLFGLFFLWYKIYYEIIFAEIIGENLYYRKLFFIRKTIDIKNIKGYREGAEEANFFILYDNNDKKIFVIRTDFYENYQEFIEKLSIQKIDNYQTVFQKIILFFRSLF